jgi:transcription antitermination factor NusG
VLFVKAARENMVIEAIKTRFKGLDFKPFAPKSERKFRKGGKDKLESELLFPGYVFIETTMDSKRF